MSIAENIKKLRLRFGVTQAELGEIAGVTDKAVSSWERGESEPRMGAVEKMARHFGIKKSEIVDDAPDPSRPAGAIPILGRIPAGPEHWVADDVEGWVQFMAPAPGRFFAVRVSGDSMAPTLLDGDLVIVREQAEVRSGDIAVVQVNGFESTCKEVRLRDDGLLLVGHNPAAYTPTFYSAAEVQQLPVVIRGRVVSLRRDF